MLVLKTVLLGLRSLIKSRDGVEEKFNPIIKESRDKETGELDGRWPPSMKVKVPRRDGVWECKVFNKDRTEYNINDSENPVNCEDLFVKNTKVPILQCVGLWIASGNYMCQWKLVKAEVDVPRISVLMISLLIVMMKTMLIMNL